MQHKGGSYTNNPDPGCIVARNVMHNCPVLLIYKAAVDLVAVVGLFVAAIQAINL